MSVKEILLTFDYELFLKNTGSVENCLLKPTNKLIDLFSKYNMHATFFIDILYYLRLKDKDTLNASKIKEQLQKIVYLGHNIELHLHPQWLDGQYNNDTWIFKTLGRYRLGSLSQKEIADLFVEGTDALEQIAREVDSNYKCIAFRAGGYCIHPFKLLKEGFTRTGIFIDSSIVPGLHCDGHVHKYDFRNSPQLDSYYFSSNPDTPDDKGVFFEIPITTFKTSFFYKYRNEFSKKINNLLKRREYKKIGDGESIGSNEEYGQNIVKRYKAKFFPQKYEKYTLDANINHKTLLKKIYRETRETITFNSHPKNLSNNSFKFIEEISKLNCDFLNIKEFYKLREK